MTTVELVSGGILAGVAFTLFLWLIAILIMHLGD